MFGLDVTFSESGGVLETGVVAGAVAMTVLTVEELDVEVHGDTAGVADVVAGGDVVMKAVP